MGSPTKARIVGPLAVYVDGFEAWLAAAGYAPGTVAAHRQLLAAVSSRCGDDVAAGELTEAQVERLVAGQWVGGRVLTLRRLMPLLGYLRSLGAIPPAPRIEPSPGARVLDAYGTYLRTERRLAPSTVVHRSEIVARFLTQRAAGGVELNLELLTVADVHGFLFGEAGRLTVGATRAVTEALRSFLRFLFATGVSARDLSGAVPGVAGHRQATLPRALDPATAAALLASCDRSTVVGVRDAAILTLMLRLGLRANEVATLVLGDIDWRAGEIAVRGKAGRADRLPLPVDVGQALVDYLQQRPATPCRTVFLRAIAPAGPLSRNGVVMVPRTASRRAGIPVVGAHRLRHTAATEMLRAGASLREVGQVLRHHAEQTTSLYASVDRASLARVVRAWPGADQ